MCVSVCCSPQSLHLPVTSLPFLNNANFILCERVSWEALRANFKCWEEADWMALDHTSALRTSLGLGLRSVSKTFGYILLLHFLLSQSCQGTFLVASYALEKIFWTMVFDLNLVLSTCFSFCSCNLMQMGHLSISLTNLQFLVSQTLDEVLGVPWSQESRVVIWPVLSTFSVTWLPVDRVQSFLQPKDRKAGYCQVPGDAWAYAQPVHVTIV